MIWYCAFVHEVRRYGNITETAIERSRDERLRVIDPSVGTATGGIMKQVRLQARLGSFQFCL